MEIRCATDSAVELDVAAELLELLRNFDLRAWAFTDEVVIEEDAIPHSHPILTLGTFNRGPFLLASYLHEQLHWFALGHMDTLERIYEQELVRRYPKVPTELPEGAGTEDSTYLHIFVCWWEVQSLRHVLGSVKAGEVAAVLEDQGVYRWVYRTIRHDEDELFELFAGSGLPTPLAT